MRSSYIRIEEFDQFTRMKSIQRGDVKGEVISVVKSFKEAEDLEKVILSSIVEPNVTPHGPAEIVDILTLQLSYRGSYGLAGIILKGGSFKTVKPSHLSHQVFRLRKLADLHYAILGHVGNILDEAKDEFIQTAKELGVKYTVIDVVDFSRLAIMAGAICPRDGNKIVDGKCSCGYRVRGSDINPLQKEALTLLQKARELNQKAGVIVLPTGSGKTRVAALDSYNSKSKKILYVAHTKEILLNAYREFSHIYGKENVAFPLVDNTVNPDAKVQLHTIQKISRDIAKIRETNYDYVIVDEFHHAAARSYRALLENIKPAFLVGLTATPFRGDRQDVIELCDENIIVEFELRTGIDSGILSPFHYYGLFDDVDYTGIQEYGYGYSVRDLNKALIVESRDNAIITKWKEIAENLPTLAFCCSVNHAIRVSESFNKSGIPADYYVGTTSYEEREELIEALRYGDLKVLCVVDIMNEGIDIPFVECLLFLRPTESKRIFFQQLGRGLRKFPGKEKVIVLDFIGNFSNAYRIIEYIGLLPEKEPSYLDLRKIRSSKEVLNIPLNCEVQFESHVIDIFAKQVLDPRKATRHNIAQVLNI